MEKQNKRKSSDFQISTQAEDGSSVLTPGRTRAQSRSYPASPLSLKSQPGSPLPLKSQPGSPLPPKSQPESPLQLQSPTSITVPKLKKILNDNNVGFDSRARKPELLQLYFELLSLESNEEPDSSNPPQNDTTSTGASPHENQLSEEQKGISSSLINPVESNHPAPTQFDNGPEQQEEARGRAPPRVEHYQNNVDGEGTDTSDTILTQERQRMGVGNYDESARDPTGQSLPPHTIAVGEEDNDQIMRDRSPPRHLQQTTGQNLPTNQTLPVQNLPRNEAIPVQKLPQNQAVPVQDQNPPHQSQSPPKAAAHTEATYDETKRVPDVENFQFINGYIRLKLWDPQLCREAEARVEGSIGKMFIMVSFDPIPRETGRPRRCFALRELPIDPEIIPVLKRGTKEQLKNYRGHPIPQDAGCTVSNMEEPQQNNWRWHSFHGDFGVEGDPERPTWFGFTDCKVRFKKNTSAMFHRTWAWAGQLPPRAPREGDERGKLQYIGYKLKDEASLTMWQRARSETPVFSREATLVSPSPAPVKPALKSPRVKREEPKSVSFRADPQKPLSRFPVRAQAGQDDESDI